MKIRKRILGFLTAAVMLCSAQAAFAVADVADYLPGYGGEGVLIGLPETVLSQNKIFTDVEDDGLYHALELLCSLEIIPRSDDALFEPDRVLTRAEALDMVLPVFLIDPSFAGGMTPSFYDVPPSHPYRQTISVAEQMGIIHGFDSVTFRPDDPIAYTEMLTILINAMGYREMAEARGGSPSGYLATAGSLKITADAADKNALTRGEAAMLLFGTLQAKAAEMVSIGREGVTYDRSKTIMEALHDTYKGQGIMTANGIASVGRQAAEIDEVIFDDTLHLKVEDGNYRDNLGYNLEYYYRQTRGMGEGVVLCMWQSGTTRQLTILADDEPEMSEGELSWTSDKGRRSARVAPDHILIKNGRRVTENYTEDVFKIQSGSMKLLSTGGSSYDIVFIDTPVNIVVSSVSIDGSDLLITPKYSLPPLRISLSDPKVVVDCADTRGNEIPFSASAFTTYDADGNTVTTYTPPAIPVGSVLSVLADKTELHDTQRELPAEDASYYRLIVSQETASGIVSSKESDPESFVIDNVRYKTAPANFLNENSREVEAGMSVEFLLDFSGRIVATADTVAAEEEYAYLINAAVSGAFSSECKLKLCLSDGSVEQFVVTNSISLNNTRVNDMNKVIETLKTSSVYANAENAEARGLSQLVRIKRSNENQITAMETLTSAEPGDGTNARLSLDVRQTTFTSKSGTDNILLQGGSYSDGPGPKYNKPVIRFNVPEFPTGQDEDYGLLQVWLDDARKTLDLYNVSEEFTPAVGIVYAPATPSRLGRPVMVSEVIKEYDEDKGIVKKLVVCNGNEMKTYSEKDNTGVFDDLKRGDLVMLYGLDTLVSQVEMLYPIDGLPDINTLPEDGHWYDKILTNIDTAVKLYYFEPYKQDGSMFAMYRGAITDGNKRERSKLLYWVGSEAVLSGGVILYDAEGNEPQVGVSTMYDVKLSSVYGNERASRIFMLEEYNDIRQIIIYNGI